MTASDVFGSSLIKAWKADPDSRAKVLSNLDTAQAGCPTLLDALTAAPSSATSELPL